MRSRNRRMFFFYDRPAIDIDEVIITIHQIQYNALCFPKLLSSEAYKV